MTDEATEKAIQRARNGENILDVFFSADGETAEKAREEYEARLGPVLTPSHRNAVNSALVGFDEGFLAGRASRDSEVAELLRKYNEDTNELILRRVPRGTHEALIREARAEALREAAELAEDRRPHIPPSNSTARRDSVVIRSTLNRLAEALRALAEGDN